MPDGTADQVETKGPVSLQEIDANQPPVVATQPDQTQPPASAVPAPAPVPAASAPSPPTGQDQKHSIIGKIVGGFRDSGSGTSASQFWRSLIGGALVGMGAAENAPVVAHGPYGDVRDKSGAGAASRAWTAEQGNLQQQKEQQQRQDQIDKQNKQREFENKLQMDDLTLRKAAGARAQIDSIHNGVEFEKRMKMLDQTIASGNWAEAERTAQRAQEQVKTFNDLNLVGAEPLKGSDGQPHLFSSGPEAEQAAHDNAGFFADKGNFKTRYVYDPTVNKYSVYRVPDTDIKNVQLKDPQTGQMHTIPRMSATEYLDYQSRVQNLKKGALEIQHVQAEIDRLHNDVKSSSLYGEALKALTAATDKDGNVNLNNIPAGKRAVLVEHSAKGLEDALRARSGAIEKHSRAVEAGDPVAIDEASKNIEEATQIVNHYSSVLTTMTGNKKAATGAGGNSVKYTVNGVSIEVPQGSEQEKGILKKYPGIKPGAPFNPTPEDSDTVNVQLPDGNTIQSTMANVGKYLNSNKGSKVADADKSRYDTWWNDDQKSQKANDANSLD